MSALLYPALSYLVRPTWDHRYRSSILDYIVDVQTIENMKYSQETARATHTTIYYTVTGEHRNINKYFRALSTSLDIKLYRTFQCLTDYWVTKYYRAPKLIDFFFFFFFFIFFFWCGVWDHTGKDIVLSAGQKQTRDIFLLSS